MNEQIKALRAARGALVEVLPCAHPECQQVQREIVDWAIKKIDAALSAPVAQPVAWLYEAKGLSPAWSKTRLPMDKMFGSPKETPLYAAPQEKS